MRSEADKFFALCGAELCSLDGVVDGSQGVAVLRVERLERAAEGGDNEAALEQR